jgi:hypothetical protein
LAAATTAAIAVGVSKKLRPRTASVRTRGCGSTARFAFVGEHPRGCRPGVGRLGREHLIEEADIDRVKTLLEPEGFGAEPIDDIPRQ